ncbi:hypothetical protein B0T22DRAFT_469954 [Podospora appendiculata]|uniref:Uncharacterized protein n=1 Tax=Podospora appendiculata TaxID=314037 RepID=A0AAE0X3S7_9PEZI|nr:hypothetical protein B0T22DRAFT_469954 [Podospora appendiculata]
MDHCDELMNEWTNAWMDGAFVFLFLFFFRFRFSALTSKGCCLSRDMDSSFFTHLMRGYEEPNHDMQQPATKGTDGGYFVLCFSFSHNASLLFSGSIYVSGLASFILQSAIIMMMRREERDLRTLHMAACFCLPWDILAVAVVDSMHGIDAKGRDGILSFCLPTDTQKIWTAHL